MTHPEYIKGYINLLFFFFLNQIILSVPELGCVCLNQVIFPLFPLGIFYVFFRLEEIILTSCAPRICS